MKPMSKLRMNLKVLVDSLRKDLEILQNLKLENFWKITGKLVTEIGGEDAEEFVKDLAKDLVDD